MPLIKTMTQVINMSSIAGGSRSTAPVYVDCTRAVQVAVTAKCQYDVPANPVPAVLEIYASRDGIELDTAPFVQAQMPVAATSRITIDVPASPNYLVAKVYNPNASSTITNVISHIVVQAAT